MCPVCYTFSFHSPISNLFRAILAHLPSTRRFTAAIRDRYVGNSAPTAPVPVFNRMAQISESPVVVADSTGAIHRTQVASHRRSTPVSDSASRESRCPVSAIRRETMLPVPGNVRIRRSRSVKAQHESICTRAIRIQCAPLSTWRTDASE